MNVFSLKYLIIIAGIIGTTAIVSSPLTPYTLTGQPGYNSEVSAGSMIQFGSETFYSELEKPGNEYLKEGVEGYSRDLLPTKEQEQRFNSAWASGIASFHTGYNGCTAAFYVLLTVPEMQDRKEKNKVCDRFRQAKDDVRAAAAAFTTAKGSVSPASSQGFLIGMVLPRVTDVWKQAEEAEISCMKAVLADRDSDTAGFTENVHNVENNIREMRRIYPELKALDSGFNQPA